MKLNKNNPKLTAYVLNELSAAEVQQIELEIKQDPELQTEVQRLKQNINQLKQLKSSEVYRLDLNRRDALFAAVQPASRWSRILKYSGGLTAAALAVTLYINNQTGLNRSAGKMSKLSADKPSEKVENISQSPPPKAASAPSRATRGRMADLADTDAPSQMSLGADSGAGAAAPQAKMQTLEGAKAFVKKSAPPPAESEAANPAYSFQLYDLDNSSSQAEVYLRISNPVFNCFSSSMSQYVQYDLSWNLLWTARLGNITTYKTEALHSSPQDFSVELRCIEAAIRSAFKSELPPSQSEKKFQYRLIIKSN